MGILLSREKDIESITAKDHDLKLIKNSIHAWILFHPTRDKRHKSFSILTQDLDQDELDKAGGGLR